MFNKVRLESRNLLAPQNITISTTTKNHTELVSSSDKNINVLDRPTAISGYKITPNQFIYAMKELIEKSNDSEIYKLLPEDKKFAESLIQAIKKYDHIARKIMMNGVEFDSSYDSHETQLYAACKNRINNQAIKLLLFVGANINIRCEENKTVLMAACESHNIELVELLLRLGSDINAVDDNHKSALKIATEMRDIAIIKILLKNKANVNATDCYGLEILSSAVTNHAYIFEPLRSLDIVDLFIQFGADVNNRANKLPICQSGKFSPLICALTGKNPNVKVGQLLLENGADILQKGISGETIFEGYEKGLFELHPENKMAIQAHWKKLVPDADGFGTQKIMNIATGSLQNLAAKAYVAHLCENQDDASTVSDEAIVKKNREDENVPATGFLELDSLVNDILIQYINAFQNDGRTYLTIAAGAGDSGAITINFLLSLGANLHQPDRHGNSPLIAAAIAEKWDTVDKLIELGAHVNQSNAQTGNSVLMAAFSSILSITKQAQLIIHLIEKGASLNLPNPDSRSSLDWPSLRDVLHYCESLKCRKLILEYFEKSTT